MAQEYDDGSKDISLKQEEHNKRTAGIVRAGENSIGDLSSIFEKMQSRGLIQENDKEALAKNGLSEEEIAKMSKNNETKDISEQEKDGGRE